MAPPTSGLDRIRVLFRQFSVGDALRLLAVDALRRAADKRGIATYSQTGEDRIIDALLGEDQGYYVDVGCNHPVSHSSTFFFYKRGWSGLCIDANEELVKLYRSARPRDRAVSALVSSETREFVFTEFFDDRVSSVDPEHTKVWRERRPVKSERRIQGVTLQSLLEEAGAPTRFELLSIDVEGHDLEVLRSVDLSAYRPTLIVVELRGFEMHDAGSHPTYRHLAEAGYRMVAYAMRNGYFLDDGAR